MRECNACKQQKNWRGRSRYCNDCRRLTQIPKAKGEEAIPGTEELRSDDSLAGSG